MSQTISIEAIVRNHQNLPRVVESGIPGTLRAFSADGTRNHFQYELKANLYGWDFEISRASLTNIDRKNIYKTRKALEKHQNTKLGIEISSDIERTYIQFYEFNNNAKLIPSRKI